MKLKWWGSGAMKKPFIFVGILIVSLSFEWAFAFLPIDESDQGNKARIAYSLAKEVSKNAKVSGTYIFPIKNWMFEQFFIFWISKMFQISGRNCWKLLKYIA